MSDIVFGFDEYRELLLDFAEQSPALLGTHPKTAVLARDVERLNILASLNTRFTVAIVGQMRVGKSTLLNAIIGRDLAPTGVTETTATINWFRHGTGGLCDYFRVHWRDGSTEDRPLSEVGDWLGQENNAKQTTALDFFADSAFLAGANIVDTPGTRSVLTSHESTTRDFVFEPTAHESEARALEAATHQEGARADAVIYVLNPVARKNDTDLLTAFGENTRMPGSSAHNSIAVVQKWEEYGLTEALRKCERIREQLDGKVAEVIPTSGLLAEYVRKLSIETWEQLVMLAKITSEDDWEDLLDSTEFFVDEMESTPLTVKERQELLDKMAWPALRCSLQISRKEGFTSGAELKHAVDQASGLGKLKKVLQKRFFAQAELIKANTVLRKAWTPCNIGLATLSRLERTRLADVNAGSSTKELLMQTQLENQTHKTILNYIESSLDAVRSDMANIRQLREELHTLKHRAQSNFEALESDLRILEEINNGGLRSISEEDQSELARICGLRGVAPWQRLGYPSQDQSLETLIERAEDLSAKWELHCLPGKAQRNSAKHALERLHQILDYLEAKVDFTYP